MITQESLQSRPLSYSSLKEFGKSPSHYIEYLRKDKAKTTAMSFGSLIHCLILEPSKFNDNFIVAPSIDRRTKEGKAEYEKFLLESNGKEVITDVQYNDGINIAEKALSQKHILDAVTSCNKFEHEWRKDINGLPFRGFFDGEADDYILEIKTSNDASPKTIINDFYNRFYHIQAGLYNIVSDKPIKYLIIETTAPYSIILADASQEFIDHGHRKIYELSKSFKTCMDNNLWNMSYDYYMDGNFTIELPSWVK